MARPTTTNLNNRLAAATVNTQTTLDLILANASEYHYATDYFTGSNLISYTPELRRTSEIKQSIDKSTDRVNVVIQNVDKVFGTVVTAEDLTKATAIIGRQYGPPATAGRAWVELFRGECRPISVTENEVTIEVLNDMAAAGLCVSHWSLAENCQFVYKHAGTCGYAGGITTCNKRRKSAGGCMGHIVTGVITNEYRFGGMEFPDPQTSSAPSGGGGDDGGVDWPPCPRLDQWTLVRGMGAPTPKLVGKLTLRDRLFDPTTGTFHAIESLDIVRDHPMMRLTAENLATSFNSPSHRVIRNRKDSRGTPAEDLHIGYSVLTYSINGRLIESPLEQTGLTGGKGDVMRIKMKTGHIYCSGHTPKAFVVAHNSKDPDNIRFI